MKLLLLPLVLFSLYANATPEDDFWSWFSTNEARLYTLENDQQKVFADLCAEITKVDPRLLFEFSSVLPNGRREFVITAGGIKDAFPAVESLYAKAPNLERWKWVKYRPRQNPMNDFLSGDTTVKVDDVRFVLIREDGKVGILLFFDNYVDSDAHPIGEIGYLLLDEALGEYVIETQVGVIQFLPSTSEYFASSRPLRDLPLIFDEYIANPDQFSAIRISPETAVHELSNNK